MATPARAALSEKLMILNLSQHEASAFLLFLFDLGRSEAIEADEVQEKACIPRSQIYEVLEGLVQKKLIVKDTYVYPYKYCKNPELLRFFNEYVDLVVKEFENRKNEVKRAAGQIEEAISGRHGLWPVGTFKEAIQNTIAMCQDSKPEDEIMITSRTFEWIYEAKTKEGKSLYEILREKATERERKKGRKIRLLLADPRLRLVTGKMMEKMEEIAENLRSLSEEAVQVGYHGLQTIRMTIVGDTCQFILWYPLPPPSEASVSLDDTGTPCVIYYTENPELVGEFKRIFDLHWGLWFLRKHSTGPKGFHGIFEKLREIDGFDRLISSLSLDSGEK